MDGDAGLESELDRFSRVLPLPYRVAIILVAGTTHERCGFDWITKFGRRLGLGCQPSLFRFGQNRRLHYTLASSRY
jgi:hypothetical protein